MPPLPHIHTYTYAPPTTHSRPHQRNPPPHTHTRTHAHTQVLPVRKMTEKFARNPSVPADGDVAKRVFYLAENKWVQGFRV